MQDFDTLTVYRTADGREALVVFSGGSDTGFRPVIKQEQPPLRGADGTLPANPTYVRIGYMNPDGSEPRLIEGEFGWADPETLTPARRLRPPSVTPQRIPGTTPAPAAAPTYQPGHPVAFRPSASTPGAPHYADRAGQDATIVRALTADEADLDETGPMYAIRFEDGVEAHVFADELTAD